MCRWTCISWNRVCWPPALWHASAIFNMMLRFTWYAIWNRIDKQTWYTFASKFMLSGLSKCWMVFCINSEKGNLIYFQMGREMSWMLAFFKTTTLAKSSRIVYLVWFNQSQICFYPLVLKAKMSAHFIDKFIHLPDRLDLLSNFERYCKERSRNSKRPYRKGRMNCWI